MSEQQIEAELRAQLERPATGRTICPSEVARALGPTGEEWRALMQPVRDVATRLADAGEVQWSQRGEAVDPRTVRGAVRLRRIARD